MRPISVYFQLFGSLILLRIYRFSRISLALSLARLFPPGHVARRLSLCIGGLCFFFFIIIIALTVGLCQGGGRPWYRIDPHYCKKGPKRIPVSGIVGVFGEPLILPLKLLLLTCVIINASGYPCGHVTLLGASFCAAAHQAACKPTPPDLGSVLRQHPHPPLRRYLRRVLVLPHQDRTWHPRAQISGGSYRGKSD